VREEKRKGRLSTPTRNGDVSMSIYVCSSNLLFTVDKRKERKKKLYCCFVRLVDTREKRQISGNTFFLFSFYSLCMLLLHRNADDDDDAILKRKKKMKNTAKNERKKSKAYKNGPNSDEHE
jgi:hypothetical protein